MGRAGRRRLAAQAAADQRRVRTARPSNSAFTRGRAGHAAGRRAAEGRCRAASACAARAGRRGPPPATARARARSRRCPPRSRAGSVLREAGARHLDDLHAGPARGPRLSTSSPGRSSASPSTSKPGPRFDAGGWGEDPQRDCSWSHDYRRRPPGPAGRPHRPAASGFRPRPPAKDIGRHGRQAAIDCQVESRRRPTGPGRSIEDASTSCRPVDSGRLPRRVGGLRDVVGPTPTCPTIVARAIEHHGGGPVRGGRTISDDHHVAVGQLPDRCDPRRRPVRTRGDGPGARDGPPGAAGRADQRRRAGMARRPIGARARRRGRAPGPGRSPTPASSFRCCRTR